MDRFLRLQHRRGFSALAHCICLIFIKHSSFGVVMPLLVKNIL
jgi:hypothetical protein